MARSKYSNDFKAKVINEGLDKTYNKMHKAIYLKNERVVLEIDGEMFDSSNMGSAFFFASLKRNKYFDCAERLCSSSYKRFKRVSDKINDLVLSNNAIFITLTFNDKTLLSTNEATRRKYVARYLKTYANNYVANIDYGGKNGREHYHAVVDANLNLANWHRYGAIKVERIRSNDLDVKRVSKYVSKLTNHALKNKGNQSRLIYSRDIG